MATVINLPEVGDGITEHLWSDSHAYTVTMIHGKTAFTAQRDKATRINRDKDNFTPGGFFGHTDHPDGQGWEYEPDPNGSLKRFTRRKDGTFRSVGRGTKAATEGRHERYDYNF